MSSNDIAISVEGLGKRYYTPQRHAKGRRGVVEHLKNMGLWAKRTEDDYFWALKDVSFEVPQGQILGILGQNGSGKSTLLKILTGVTPPTTGRAVIKGRIGSLLEVGTGFHPDLSGRDNVFMNGALLGIPKAEIRKRFDEIVDFAGLEEFIDVPVKRYSSGMYVRLAYAVASMLDTDILILDEVLAVGDAGFQEKARQNMRSIVASGRTILLVSHHIRTVAGMCDSAILLNRGNVAQQGRTREVVSAYLEDLFAFTSAEQKQAHAEIWDSSRLHDPPVQRVFSRVDLFDANNTPCTEFITGKSFIFRVQLQGVAVAKPYCAAYIVNEYGDYAAVVYTTHSKTDFSFSGDTVITCRIDQLCIGEGQYYLMLDYGRWTGVPDSHESLDCVPAAIRFAVKCDDFIHLPKPTSYFGSVSKSTWSVA